MINYQACGDHHMRNATFLQGFEKVLIIRYEPDNQSSGSMYAWCGVRNIHFVRFLKGFAITVRILINYQVYFNRRAPGSAET